MEAKPIVDSPDVAGLVEEAVATLPVRVVRDGVEYAKPLQLRPEGGVFPLDKIVSLGVVAHEELERPRAVRAFAHHGRRDQSPAERASQTVGGYLTPIKRAVRKIPKRGFAIARFVNRKQLTFTVSKPSKVNVIR